MNKKSKVLMIGAAVAAVTVFTATALATTPKTTGYDAFKEVLKANHMSGHTIESATFGGNFTVAVDGETVLTANGVTKVGGMGKERDMSSDFNLTLMGVERSGSLYSSDEDKLYIVDRSHDLHYQIINLDDEEYGAEYREWRGREEFRDRPMNKAEEAFLDYMVGDLKDNFSAMEHADGSKTITVEVSKEEIPLPLRLLMDVASAEDKRERVYTKETPEEWERMKQLPFFQGLEEVDLEEQLPELTEDVAIERVKLQLTVDANNELQGVEGVLEVSGKDEAGLSHLVEIEGEGSFSNFNATTPDVYDPTGKTVEIIDAATFDDRG